MKAKQEQQVKTFLSSQEAKWVYIAHDGIVSLVLFNYGKVHVVWNSPFLLFLSAQIGSTKNIHGALQPSPPETQELIFPSWRYWGLNSGLHTARQLFCCWRNPVILEIGFCFLPSSALPTTFLLYASYPSWGDRNVSPCSAFILLRWGMGNFFCPG
jgi:hypothetical protein